eukprot:TRINITY_DN72170_c0_g1_i1.p1 TRINITY_DN72170_c0_g1~~TRINITY_DN72170_c0_g1_i1.p1  ORF type:complete len:331 (-),score=58.57 TRINITY_DN72170_c0_g1_i1:30-1022(-)
MAAAAADPAVVAAAVTAAAAPGADAGAGTPPFAQTQPQRSWTSSSAAASAPADVGSGGGSASAPQEDADLREYADGLGVDLDVHGDLLWIVSDAFHAPLPVSWTEHTDDEGRCYFFHEGSGESTWEHPTDSVYREILSCMLSVRAQSPPLSSEQRAALIHDHLRQVHQRALVALEGWSGPYASEVGEYYYNKSLKVSTWESPVIAWEHELLIRHAALCRGLLPEQAAAGAEGSAAGGASSSGAGMAGMPGAGSGGQDILQALQLPLNLVRREVEDPETPSTTRSYHTARSVLSTRSQQLSGRSGDKFARERDRAARTKSGRSAQDAGPSL